MDPSENTRSGWLQEKASLDTLPDAYKEKKTAEGPKDLNLGDLLKQQQFRKLNRIAGYLEKRSTEVPEVAPVSAALNDALKKEAEGKPAQKEWKAVSKTMAAASATELPKGATPGKSAQENKVQSWQKFSALSTMGALNNWVPEQGKAPDVDTNMRAMRRTMVARDEMTIVAHRGSGPTNRTFGGKIGDNDYRRTDYPAENSPQAMKAAYSKMPPGNPGGLDGVETDVYLSQDNKAILSHEGAIKEQLSVGRKQEEERKQPQQLNDHSRIEKFSSETLTSIPRTDNPESRFQSLSEFLESTREPGKQYFENKQEAMRVEIEMKGHLEFPKKTTDEEKTRLTGEYKQTMAKEVGKNISQFNKDNQSAVPHEIVMFNNSSDDARQFDQLRKFKTRLGNVYTGIGQGNMKDTTAESLEKLAPTVDEIRTSVTNADKVDELAAPLDQFKVTLVTKGDRTTDDPDKMADLDFGPNTRRGRKKDDEDKRRAGIQGEWKDVDAEAIKMSNAINTAHGKPNVGLLIDDHAKVAGYRQQEQALRQPAQPSPPLQPLQQPAQGQHQAQPGQPHLQQAAAQNTPPVLTHDRAAPPKQQGL